MLDMKWASIHIVADNHKKVKDRNIQMKKGFVKQLGQLPPLVLCVLVLAVTSILVLVMLSPTAGAALTSFLMALNLMIERLQRNGQIGEEK